MLIILLHWPIGILKYLFKIDANISEPPVLKPDRYIIPLAIPIDIEDTKTIKNSFFKYPCKLYENVLVNDSNRVNIADPIIVYIALSFPRIK